MRDGFADEGSGADTVPVDIVPEAFVQNIHLTQADKNLLGAGVVVICNVLLQLFHHRLRSGRIGSFSIFHNHNHRPGRWYAQAPLGPITS